MTLFLTKGFCRFFIYKILTNIQSLLGLDNLTAYQPLVRYLMSKFDSFPNAYNIERRKYSFDCNQAFGNISNFGIK